MFIAGHESVSTQATPNPVFWMPLNDNAADRIIAAQIGDDGHIQIGGSEATPTKNTEDMSVTGPNSVANTALSFPNFTTDEWGVIAPPAITGGQMSISMWVQGLNNPTNPDQVVLGCGGDNRMSWFFNRNLPSNPDQIAIWDFDGGASTYHYFADTPADTNWHHFLWLHDGGTVSLYLDGVFESSLSVNTTIFFDVPGSVGGQHDGLGTNIADANISDLRLFDQILTADQIAWLADAANVGADTHTPLFTKGHVAVNTFAALHTTGSIAVDTTPPDPTLYVDGLGVTNRTGLLYVEGVGNPTTNTFAPLFVQVDNGSINDGTVTLYVPNTQTSADVPATGSRTLFIQSEITAMGKVATLFVEGTGTFDSAPLYIKATGVLPGAVPLGRGAPLFINRPNEAVAMSLFCKALDNPVNSTMPLHTISFLTAATTPPALTLVIPEVTSVPLNSYASLYVGGMGIENTGPSPNFWMPLHDNEATTDVVAHIGDDGVLTDSGNTEDMSVTGPNSVVNTALSFPLIPEDGYVDIAPPELTSGKMAVSMWVQKLTEPWAPQSVLLSVAGTYRIDWYLTKGGLGHQISVWEFDGGPGTYHDLMATPTDTNWHHYLWVFDNGTLSFYFDGSFVTSVSGFGTTTFFETGEAAALGNRYDGSSLAAEANLSDFRIFDLTNQTLTTEDIDWLADATNVGKQISPLLFTHGHGLLNATAPLFVKQNNQPLNTYTSLFTQGVEGIVTTSIPDMTLVIPDVIDVPTATIPFYIFGW